MFTCHISSSFLALVVHLGSHDLLLFTIAHLVEVFLGHELVVHTTLQVILGQTPALVVDIFCILQAIYVFLLVKSNSVCCEKWVGGVWRSFIVRVHSLA